LLRHFYHVDLGEITYPRQWIDLLDGIIEIKKLERPV